MKLCLVNHSFRYELEKLIRIFLPFEKIEFSDEAVREEPSAVTMIINANEASCELYFNGTVFSEKLSIEENFEGYEKECELKLATALYDCFTKATGYTAQWGILTGVRPAKLFSRLCESIGEENAICYFRDKLKVAYKKILLCRETVESERKIVSISSPESYSLYISIPFCPTRCAYCSFVSHSVDKAKSLIPAYIDRLCEEIRVTSKLADLNGLRLETVYIGGGTPTSIETTQLKKVLSAVCEYCDLSFLKEFTVEAGRPDTINKDNLSMLKAFPVTRISINPQSMNDSVLEKIGRHHTSDDTVKAFKLARQIGFDNINMDLIAGLPSDTADSFKNTVERVIELNPESVTVHSLSIKRSSNMTKNGDLPDKETGETASFMVDYTKEKLSQNGILPYYMYRQSKTVGNLENVGYAKKGYECLYNVYIMDETHTILSCGASAVTKLRQPYGNYIERIFNFKYPYEYIDRFNELILRKNGVTAFYDKYGWRNK